MKKQGYSIRKAVEITGCKFWQAREAQKSNGSIGEQELDELRKLAIARGVEMAEDSSAEERQKTLDLQKIEINKQEIRKRQLEIAEIEGRLIPVTMAVEISGARFRSLRDGLLAIPRRVTDEIMETAKRGDRLGVVEILNNAITGVLLASKSESFVKENFSEQGEEEE